MIRKLIWRILNTDTHIHRKREKEFGIAITVLLYKILAYYSENIVRRLDIHTSIDTQDIKCRHT